MRFVCCVLLLAAAALAAGCKEEGAINVHRLSFAGVKAVDESRLREALATRQSSRIPWGRKYFFDRSRFDADRKRIEAFYADRGYPAARVSGFDVKLNTKQDAVDLLVTIAKGEPVTVAAIDYVGFDVVPPDHLDQMKSNAPLRVGQPRDRQLVVSTHELALNELRDHGFPYAKVSTKETPGADDTRTTLTFTAEPGKVAHFGPVEIQANKSVGDHIIERELTFKPGDLYRRSVVQDSQRRLYGMELFQFVNIEPQNPELQAADVPMKVTVAEGKHQRVNLGVGYGTEEKARADFEYHHLNFLGGARSAGVHGRYSSLDRGVRLDFHQPYFFAPHFTLSGEGQDWYTFTPAYSSVVAGARATLTHKTSEKSSWSVSMTSEHDRSTVDADVLANPELRSALIALGLDPVTGVQNGTLNAFGFDLQRSTADNLLNAHRGYQIAFHAEQAGRIVPGTFGYDAVSADGRQYLPLGSDRFVLASRLQIGNIQPASSDPTKVPFAKKYLLGGATSIRGWGRYEVSPLADGLPIGGNSMLAFSEEVRAVISGNFGGVLFLDGGNVWADSWGIRLNDLRYSIGPGLRYQTPIGPIRFDVGFQLNPNPDLIVNGATGFRTWRMHFSIGQAY